MKLHRFYSGEDIELRSDFWLHDPNLLGQWNRVLRFWPGQKIVLFDGKETDRLYEIEEINDKEVHLRLVTEMSRQTPKREVYLFWSLLKKDKNEWVLQKCTEIGVSNFVPIISDRCDKTDLSDSRLERWKKIVTEAAEQCGRSDIPEVRAPIKLITAIEEYHSKIKLLVCEQGEEGKFAENDKIGIFIGPEGGWSDSEKTIFDTRIIEKININDFTLRAETASVVTSAKLLQ